MLSDLDRGRRVRLWAKGTAFDATAVTGEWFNPFAVESFSTFAAGVSLSVFI